MLNGKREVFKFKQEPKKLSNAQYFSKLYYPCYYKKPITSRWRDTYIAYFHRINEDSSLTLADAMKMEQQVNDSIIKDLRARLLDITVAVASGVEGNFGEGEGEDHEDIKEDDEDQDQEAEDTGLSSDESNCPKSPYGFGTQC
jgi:hypothetical protein